MNSLSWMLYIADVSDGIDWLLNVVAFMGVAGLVLWAVVGICMASEENGGAEFWRGWRRAGVFLWILAPFGIIASSIVPEKETVYAIAASEMGESALNTKTGGKAVEALNAWLDRQIKGDDK